MPNDVLSAADILDDASELLLAVGEAQKAWIQKERAAGRADFYTQNVAMYVAARAMQNAYTVLLLANADPALLEWAAKIADACRVGLGVPADFAGQPEAKA